MVLFDVILLIQREKYHQIFTSDLLFDPIILICSVPFIHINVLSIVKVTLDP